MPAEKHRQRAAADQRRADPASPGKHAAQKQRGLRSPAWQTHLEALLPGGAGPLLLHGCRSAPDTSIAAQRTGERIVTWEESLLDIRRPTSRGRTEAIQQYLKGSGAPTEGL